MTAVSRLRRNVCAQRARVMTHVMSHLSNGDHSHARSPRGPGPRGNLNKIHVVEEVDFDATLGHRVDLGEKLCFEPSDWVQAGEEFAQRRAERIGISQPKRI